MYKSQLAQYTLAQYYASHHLISFLLSRGRICLLSTNEHKSGSFCYTARIQSKAPQLQHWPRLLHSPALFHISLVHSSGFPVPSLPAPCIVCTPLPGAHRALQRGHQQLCDPSLKSEHSVDLRGPCSTSVRGPAQSAHTGHKKVVLPHGPSFPLLHPPVECMIAVSLSLLLPKPSLPGYTARQAWVSFSWETHASFPPFCTFVPLSSDETSSQTGQETPSLYHPQNRARTAQLEAVENSCRKQGSQGRGCEPMTRLGNPPVFSC